MDKLLY